MPKRDIDLERDSPSKLAKLDKEEDDFNPKTILNPMELIKDLSIESEDDMESEELEEHSGEVDTGDKEVWTPNKPLASDEELECAPGTYNMYHTMNTEYPCLSFDIIDMYKGTELPARMAILGGTQADIMADNCIYIMNWSHITRTLNDGLDSEEAIDDDEPVIGGEPVSEIKSIPHPWGTVNKIVSCKHLPRLMATSGSDANIRIWDIKSYIKDNSEIDNSEIEPMCIMNHNSEGFGLEFNPLQAGALASACRGGVVQLHKPRAASKYETIVSASTPDNMPIESLSHTLTDGNIIYLGGADGNIWRLDERIGKVESVSKKAHIGDINVISCVSNPSCPTLVATGGDDCITRIWDSRAFDFGAALTMQKDAISGLAWSPIEASVLATASYDDSILIWDLSVEKADEPNIIAQAERSGASQYPEEVLFDHRGDSNITAIKYHPCIPDTLISCSSSGFRLFQPRFME